MTEDTIKQNEIMIKSLLSGNIDQPGVVRLIKWLNSSGFFKAPASIRYNLSEEGGLAQHAINIYNRLVKLLDIYGSEFDHKFALSSITIVSLLCNISKARMYKSYTKNEKQEDGTWKPVTKYMVVPAEDRLFYGTPAETSIYILREFLQLTHEEEVAILYHSGGYDVPDCSLNSDLTLTAYKFSPLAFYLHVAELQALCIDEAY